MALTHAKLAAQCAASLGVDDLRLAELVRHHADVAHPNAVRETRAQRFDDRFLGSKAHRQKPHGSFRLGEQRQFLVEQYTACEMLAEALPRSLDALRLQDVRANPE